MKVDIEAAIALLHEARHGTLATHSTQAPGYPYATVVPHVADEAHRPVFCVSALAEHTKNLLADPRVSYCVVQPDCDDVQANARLTLVGDAERFAPSDAFLARYLRYEPGAEQLLKLDFTFFRLTPVRIRFIAGVGRMCWIEARDWNAVPAIAADAEQQALRAVAPALPAGVHLLGLDCFGIDFEVHSRRARQRVPGAPVAAPGLPAIASRMAHDLG